MTDDDSLDVDPDDVSESTSVNVDAGEKIEWMRAVHDNDTEYQSLSHLIKTGVRHELDENFGFINQQQQEQSQEVNVDLTQVEGMLETIDERLTRIEADIDITAEERTPDPNVERGSDEFFRITGQVHDNLPLVSSEEELTNMETALELPINERAKITGYVGDIAAAIDEPESVVRDAAMYLSEQYDSVSSVVEVDGTQRRFYEIKQ